MQTGEGSSRPGRRRFALLLAALGALLLATSLSASTAQAHIPHEIEFPPLFAESVAMFGVTDCQGKSQHDGQWEEVCRRFEVLADGTGWTADCIAFKSHHHIYGPNGEEMSSSPPTSEAECRFAGKNFIGCRANSSSLTDFQVVWTDSNYSPGEREDFDCRPLILQQIEEAKNLVLQPKQPKQKTKAIQTKGLEVAAPCRAGARVNLSLATDPAKMRELGLKGALGSTSVRCPGDEPVSVRLKLSGKAKKAFSLKASGKARKGAATYVGVGTLPLFVNGTISMPDGRRGAFLISGVIRGLRKYEVRREPRKLVFDFDQLKAKKTLKLAGEDRAVKLR